MIGYVLLVAALSWPLPRNLTTHLLGDPGGDTGVYVWNVWVFRHELVDHGRLPLSTVTAAPLPFFLWALLRALDDRRRRSAALIGGLPELVGQKEKRAAQLRSLGG